MGFTKLKVYAWMGLLLAWSLQGMASAPLRVALCGEFKGSTAAGVRDALELEVELSSKMRLVPCKGRVDLRLTHQGDSISLRPNDGSWLIKKSLPKGGDLNAFAARLLTSMPEKRRSAPAPKEVPTPKPAIALASSLALSQTETSGGEEFGYGDPERERVLDSLGFVSALVGAEGWRYRLWGVSEEKTSADVVTRAIPRSGLALEFNVLPWLGLNFEVAGGLTAFRMKVWRGTDLPGQLIWTRTLQGAAGSKFRWGIGSGWAVSLRSAYRFWGAFSDVQSVSGQLYTQVPSFHMHALELGPEVSWVSPATGLDLRLGILGLPLVYYAEWPDSPGEGALSFGFGGYFSFRYAFYENWHLLLDMRSLGVYAQYQGQGTRETTDREKFQGGDLLNMTWGGSIGLGWSF